MEVINYKPPPTIREFIKDYRRSELFYDWIVGPVGSGKTTALFFKLVYMAQMQEPSKDGIRRTRAVIVRNTLPQLRDTTLVSWGYWFKHGVAGEWKATENRFILRFGDVECDVLFRPLDTADDIARVLSLEINFAIIDEFVNIPRDIVDALSARLGRYKMPDGVKPTNWGMWGSSNPSTEDNWWYDFLHNSEGVKVVGTIHPDEDAQRAIDAMSRGDEKPGSNAKYFVQPSGFSEWAENLENLPGGRAYYENQAKGKNEAWVKQFIEAEWGYSVAGKAVVASFKSDLHVSKKKLIFDPHLPLVVGFDPGLGGSAFIFMQETRTGRLHVLAECVQVGLGTDRLITDVFKPFVRRNFPNASIVLAPDPAASNRTPNDERTVVDRFKHVYREDANFKVSTETNNRLPLRLDAIDYFTCRLTQDGAALQIDPDCKHLIRGLKGGWRWEVDTKRDVLKDAAPEKNPSSHPCDAFGYGCRYYHKGAERSIKTMTPGRTFRPSQAAVNQYHFR